MRRHLIFLLLVFSLPVAAQSTQAELRLRLMQKKPLYLRGQWASGQLRFDSSGNLLGNSDGFPFTLCGVEIRSVKLGAKGLELNGNRIAIVFTKNNFDGQRMGKLRIEVEAPANGDYRAALDKMFTTDLADFVPALPSYWQAYANTYLLSAGAPEIALEKDPKVKTIGRDVLPPKLISSKQPEFPDYAKKLKVDGHVLVYLQVDAVGKPGHLRIVKPLGAGLDEQAIRAVSQYRFKPATENGVPVPVEMNVDVAFKIY